MPSCKDFPDGFIKVFPFNSDEWTHRCSKRSGMKDTELLKVGFIQTKVKMMKDETHRQRFVR